VVVAQLSGVGVSEGGNGETCLRGVGGGGKCLELYLGGTGLFQRYE